MKHRHFALLVALTVLGIPAIAPAQTFHTQKFDIGGTGNTDYLAADPATGRVYISRSTHVMVVDGLTGKVLGDIPDTPRVHGIAFAQKEGYGFTTNAGDSTLTMFDLKTNSVVRKVHIGTDGADGIWYDENTGTILSINHSHPIGTLVLVDAKSGAVRGTIKLSGMAPEGAASDTKGRVFINIEDKNAIDVVDLKSMQLSTTWSIEPCEGPTGIAFDRASNRIMSGCDGSSVVVNAATGKIVATIPNGDGVDALGWDAAEQLMYIPSGRGGNVTVVHQDSPDAYTVIATVPTFVGAKTISVDAVTHRAYVFTPEYEPAPPPPAGTPPARPARGPIKASWFFAIIH